jgi:homoserine O-succinyltransferase/O-acetyltransferase
MTRTPSGDAPPYDARPSDGGPLVIGLVNNMGDAALHTTERQFRDLITAASNDGAVHLRCFSFPEVTRSDVGRAYVNKHYEPIDNLWSSRLDGLIVSGAEPRAPTLAGESYWPVMTRLVEWADAHTTSTVWSCLAAHAAVLHLDGVARTRLPEKISGVFACAKTSEDELMTGMPSRWYMPHSRQNDLSAEALGARGYRALSTSSQAGVDVFVKQRQSLFVFVQGHPEYDPQALLREYHRDIGRFLSGKADTYPEMPLGYFDGEVVAALSAFRQRAVRVRHPELLRDFPLVSAGARLSHPWRWPAERLYGNWLARLTAERRDSTVPARDDRTAAVHPR